MKFKGMLNIKAILYHAAFLLFQLLPPPFPLPTPVKEDYINSSFFFFWYVLWKLGERGVLGRSSVYGADLGAFLHCLYSFHTEHIGYALLYTFFK